MAPQRARTLARIPDTSLHESEHGAVALVPDTAPATVDSLAVWSERYQQLAVAEVRSEEVAKKIALQLGRFIAFYQDAYGHDRVSTCLKRDVVAWQQHLKGWVSWGCHRSNPGRSPMRRSAHSRVSATACPGWP